MSKRNLEGCLEDVLHSYVALLGALAKGENIEGEVEELAYSIDEAFEGLGVLEDYISDLKSDNRDLEDRINGLERQIGDLESRIAE